MDPEGPQSVDSPQTFADAINAVHDVLARLQEDLHSANERAGLREQVIARLHEENERLRAGERNLLLKPVQVDLQRLRTDLLRQAETLPEVMTAEAVRNLLTSFAVSVELALERVGIGVFRPEAGTPFDPTHHRAVEVLPASSPEADTTIAEVLGDGYVDSTTGRVVAAAPVRVWRWQTDLQPAAPVVPSARPQTD